jgi:hypothetical protein
MARKAFDCVRHEKLMEILEEIGLEESDRNIIQTHCTGRNLAGEWGV